MPDCPDRAPGAGAVPTRFKGAQRAMINPASIPYSRAYIKDAREVATEKNCAFVQ